MSLKVVQGLVGKTGNGDGKTADAVTPTRAQDISKLQSASQTPSAVTLSHQIQSSIQSDAAVVTLRYTAVSGSSARGERLSAEKAERLATDVADKIRESEDGGASAHQPDRIAAKSSLN